MSETFKVECPECGGEFAAVRDEGGHTVFVSHRMRYEPIGAIECTNED